MPNVLSKFFAGTLKFKLLTAECHEISHVWHPNCWMAIWDAVGDGMRFSLKTFGTLYFINSLVKHKGNLRRIEWKKLLRDILRSSIFLTMNLALFLFWLCRLRQILGFIIWPTISFVNSFLASLCAILIETKSRRGMNALYLLNVASEAAFRQLQHRNLVRTLPKGECLIFGVGLAGIFYLLQKIKVTSNRSANSSSANFLRKLFFYIFGRIDKKEPLQLEHRALKFLERSLPEPFLKRHRLCLHHGPCSTNAIKVPSRNFGIVFSLNFTVQFVRGLFGLRKAFTTILRDSFKLPLFLTVLPLVYQSLQCATNHLLNANNEFTQSVAGCFSGIFAMAFYPSTSLALYTFWKMAEMVYFHLASLGVVRIFPWADALLYALSAGYLLGLAVLEPQALRPSYLKFLRGLTGDRVMLFNRTLFDLCGFGFDSTKLFPNYIQKRNERQFLTINPSTYMTQFSL